MTTRRKDIYRSALLLIFIFIVHEDSSETLQTLQTTVQEDVSVAKIAALPSEEHERTKAANATSPQLDMQHTDVDTNRTEAIRKYLANKKELNQRNASANNALETRNAKHHQHPTTQVIGEAESGTGSAKANQKAHAQSWWRKHDTNRKARKHPFMGARGDDGSTGWVVDPSTDRLATINITQLRTNHPAMCEPDLEGKGGSVVFHQRLLPGLQKTIHQLDQAVNKSKILCMVYTAYTNDDQHQRLRSISETWATRCDGFIAASNTTDHSLGAVDLLHEGPEEYGNMWQKIRSMWSYAYSHYLDEFDYFYICGDDTYVNVDNLRLYVDGSQMDRLKNGYLDRISSIESDIANAQRWAKERPRPLLLGTPMRGSKSYLFPAGGGGYALNRAALGLFGRLGSHSYMADVVTSQEDVLIGGFFKKVLGICITDTSDEGERFRFAGTAEVGFHEHPNKPSVLNKKMLRRKYGYAFNRSSVDSVSESQISFHLKDDRRRLTSINRVPADLMRRYHALYYGWCPGDKVVD